ncbi:MAG TPA: PAS domain S-box protein, partial [Clostridia bacterium]
MKKTKSNPDASRLRVLILEDKPADAELIERELRRAGIVFTSRLVEGKRKYSKALADFQPQVILADFKLPLFDGLAALKITRLLAPDVPFIFVSGSIGEEKAIELLAQGASDYILKDTLQRLGPAVKRVIEATCLKLEKKKSDEELQRYIDELQLLSEGADHFVHINDLDELYDYLAQTIRDLSGADYLLLSLYDEKLQAVRPKIVTGFEPFQETIHRRFHIDLMEMVFYLKDMRQDDFSDFVSRRLIPVRDGLYGLANRKIPRSTCRLIEKLLAVGSMHTMGFSWENQLFGGLTVFFKKANKLKNASQIEALANLAAVSIKRLLVEQALRESEKKYRTLVTQSPDGIFVIDLQGNFLSVNQAMCAGLKYSEEEFLSLKIWDIVPEQYMDLHKKRLAAILKGKEINEAAEYMVRGKDGETHYVAILSTPFYKDNTLIGFQGIARDISESKKMEIRLRESEEYYRILVETSPDAIIIVDGGGRVTFASSKAHQIFGIPAQIPIIGVSLLDFVEPGEIPRVQERMVEILSGHSLPEINEYRLLKHDRQPFWGEVSASPLRDAAGRSIGLLIVCRDISERKRAESQREAALEELRISAEKWQSTFNSITDIVSVISPDHMFLEINKAGCDAMGLKREDIIGKKCYELVHHLHNPLTGCPCSLTIQSKKMEVNEVLENGRYYQLTAWPILDANGELLAFSHTVKDISDRKRAEEQIQYQASLLQNVSDAIIATDKNSNIQAWNKAAEKIYDWKAEETIGKKLHDVITPEYHYQSREEVIEKLEKEGAWSGEIIHHRRDGNPLIVQSSI